ncbi:5-(carboxyamino)imidazole ribonucleotide synthase [Metallosphaera tengchongensis]|uniref:N5-carboxyaminoimidazole ribonucleotide synthase n=1 Tax=Metallosphaera tengchongensis TaxID=1532350 RepID=A0A6N0NQI6_9CREN|nr:5-(carboxyamino)imidazole ribonucleotide synthase [Metallosphaera tengchongensis]QKQ99133.1 5-(carboxyamino)imidazole ribonucleotide synthase [Metallosphaera tengchongensis]
MSYRPHFNFCILGGGQLGWMMVLEGSKFPINFYVYADREEPACRVARCFKEDYKKIIEECDVVTFEFEHVDEGPLTLAHDLGKLLPGLNSVNLKRARHLEKEYLRKEGFPVPRFITVENGDEALRVLRDEFGGVGVIKKSEGGYDGKGQYFVKGNVEDFRFLEKEGGYFVVEEFVDFDYEASIIAVRRGGEFKSYPGTFNYNEKGILVYNYGPYENQQMRDIAKELTSRLNYTGVIGIEFFVKEGKVMINEFAPRVHNTGHYTLDGAEVSQFEQHVRALSGLELGSTEVMSFSGTVNVLGIQEPPLSVLQYGTLYWYGKNSATKRRKMGHINVIGENLLDVKAKIEKVMKILYPNGLDL